MSVSAKRLVQHAFVGRVEYGRSLALQERLRAELRRGAAPESLVLLEHPHVYTLGRSARREDVTATAEWLRTRGVAVVETDRGGQVTYHGPGQLVGYPILDLSPDRRDVRRYVRDLLEVLVRTLAEHGVAAEARTGQPEIGIWAGGCKIASIGVHLSRWITTHGFALNVTTDLDYFAGIVPCGLGGVRMASIQSLTGGGPALEDVAATAARNFAAVFDRRLEPVDAGSWVAAATG